MMIRSTIGMLLLMAAVLPAEDYKKAVLNKECPYPERTKEELDAVGAFKRPKGKLKPIYIVLASSKKDHGPETHDYTFFQKRWQELLSLARNVTVDTSNIWPSDAQYAKADVVVFCCRPKVNSVEVERLNRYLRNGGGAVFIHIGLLGDSKGEQRKNVGLCWEGKCRYRHGKMVMDCTQSSHPITKGFGKVKFYDETYWALKGDLNDIEVIGTAMEGPEGAQKAEPQMWVRSVGKGLVFTNILGHYSWTFDDPLFRILTLRGIAWVADDNINRFQKLYTLGAHYKE